MLIRFGASVTLLLCFGHFHLFVCLFCLNGRLPEGRKLGIPLGILPHVREQKKRSYFQAGSILTLRLPGIKLGTWLNTKKPSGPMQIGIQSAPGETRLGKLPLVKPQV